MAATKKLWYQLTDNVEMSVTTDINTVAIIIDEHMKEYTEKDEVFFTVTPVWLTDRQYAKLPESESY